MTLLLDNYKNIHTEVRKFNQNLEQVGIEEVKNLAKQITKSYKKGNLSQKALEDALYILLSTYIDIKFSEKVTKKDVFNTNSFFHFYHPRRILDEC
ncbi:MAG TPA: hypothetical protein ENN33_10710 [Ignavibacteria bacterium]|nr:hypothetical protein [Ignavibacteria bacterium]